MATPTYTLIDSVTLGSSASSVTFSGISAAGKGDLVLAIQQNSATAQDIRLRFNGDSGSNYSYVYMLGNGSTATSEAGSFSAVRVGVNSLSTGTNKQQAIIQIMDYASDKHKSVLARSNVTGGDEPGAEATANRWANTSAITTILIGVSATEFVAGSTFFLYQIVSE